MRGVIQHDFRWLTAPVVELASRWVGVKGRKGCNGARMIASGGGRPSQTPLTPFACPSKCTATSMQMLREPCGERATQTTPAPASHPLPPLLSNLCHAAGAVAGVW